MNKRILVLSTSLLLAAGCGQNAPPVDTVAEAKAILAMEAEWSKAAAAADMEKFVGFYSDDASVFPPNMAVATGKESIRKALGGLFGAPGFSLTFQSTKVDVARSGDLAYSSGSYSLMMKDPKGAAMTDQGKFVATYRKQADGSWKVTSDIFNSDLPLAPPPK
ncbi:MAG: YybH family protein [Bryobacteraceae bacterium]